MKRASATVLAAALPAPWRWLPAARVQLATQAGLGHPVARRPDQLPPRRRKRRRPLPGLPHQQRRRANRRRPDHDHRHAAQRARGQKRRTEDAAHGSVELQPRVRSCTVSLGAKSRVSCEVDERAVAEWNRRDSSPANRLLLKINVTVPESTVAGTLINRVEVKAAGRRR